MVDHDLQRASVDASYVNSGVSDSTSDVETQSRPPVIRGTELHVGIDWLRMTGPEPSRVAVYRYLCGRFGQPVAAKGRYFYDSGFRFAGDLLFLFNVDVAGSQHFCVEAPGGFLAGLEAGGPFELLRDLDGFAMNCTRLDLRVDHRGQDIRLIQQMIEGCRRGELTGARTWEERKPYTGGTISGFGCNVGRRGKNGSGRYVRVYDKGLETKTGPIGQWVRFEAELSSGCAAKAGGDLVGAEDAYAAVLEIAYGCLDFREANGRASLERRPRCPWWVDVLESVEPRRIRAERSKPSIDATAKWLRTQVSPVLCALADATDRDEWHVFADLVGPRPVPTIDALMRPVVMQYVERLREASAPRPAWEGTRPKAG